VLPGYEAGGYVPKTLGNNPVATALQREPHWQEQQLGGIISYQVNALRLMSKSGSWVVREKPALDTDTVSAEC
jgi:hypothetical protein